MIYLALGRRKLGKTTLIYSMARKCSFRAILDPRGLIQSGAVRVSTSDGVSTAFEMMRDGQEHEVLITPEFGLQDVFDHTARQIKTWSKERDDVIMLVVDEARFFDLRQSPAFEYILRATAPERVHIAITAHRPADIPTDVRAISDHWLLFKSTQEHDLKVIEERCGIAVRQRVSRLNPHEFIHWDDAVGDFREHKDPSTWFVPLASKASPTLDSDILPVGGEVDKNTLF